MGLISKETFCNLGAILMLPFCVLSGTLLSYFSIIGGWEDYFMPAWFIASILFAVPFYLVQWRILKSPPKETGAPKESIIPDELLVLGAVILLPLFYFLAGMFVPRILQKTGLEEYLFLAGPLAWIIAIALYAICICLWKWFHHPLIKNKTSIPKADL